MRRGGRCRFGCYEGHRLRGDSSVTCQDSGLWTNEMQPFCESKKDPYKIEPPHDKTNKITCALSEDSDQPGHPPSLISLRLCSLGR